MIVGFQLLSVTSLLLCSITASSQEQSAPHAAPVIQPGAPGQSSRTLSSVAAAAIPEPHPSAADTEFMQGMIMHHGQAVEMTALIAARTHNKDVQSIGRKISISQTDEIKFMKSWLEVRGHETSMHDKASAHMNGILMPDMDMSSMSMPLMPGMLTSSQMSALRKASGPEFDHLFLAGMIQHHTGALTMVDQLFGTAGAGQDADLFDFATDVDNTQRAEIKIMQGLLKEKQ